MTDPWENEDGSTNVEGFLTAYADDNNTFWRAEQGHIQNVLEALIDRNDVTMAAVRSAAKKLYAAEVHRQGIFGWDDYCTHTLIAAQHELAALTSRRE